MKNITLFINTAFNVSDVNLIKTSKGETRINQYKEGISRLFEVKDIFLNCNLILSDNTISNIKEIDERILNSIPLE